MPEARPSAFVIGTAVASACIAIAALTGWAFDLPGLKTVAPGLASLKPNTALGLLLGAGALVVDDAPRDAAARRLARGLCVAVVAALGVTALVEYAFRVDLGVDELLFRDIDSGAGDAPGRMSVLTAISFCIFAAAMALPKTVALEAAFVCLCTAGLLIAFLALVGYAYGVELLHRPTPQASIALHTAVAFVLLFVGASATRPRTGWFALLRSPSVGGAIARRLLPAVIGLPLLLGAMRIYGEQSGLFGSRTGAALLVVMTIVMLAGLTWRGARLADQFDHAKRAREQIHRSILDNALDAFVLMDAKGRVAEWNQQAERIFGWSRADAVGRSLAELVVPPPLRATHEAGLARFLETGQGKIVHRRIELSALRREGGEFPAELVVIPVLEEGVWTFAGFARDVSRRQEIERQLRQAQKMEAVGQLTGGVAHDFNNLLTIIIGGLDLELENLEGRTKATLANALSAAERGAALVHQLLAFSRKQTLQPERLDVGELAQGMLELLRRTLGDAVEVELRLSRGLWPVQADRSQLESALLNLAINARDAMPQGGRLTIETANSRLDDDYALLNPEVASGDYVMLAVSDTGVGMTPETAAKAFEPFFTTKDVGKGSGLGLSMIYGFAKQSGGHLKIYSEVGHGTTMRLYLPRDEADGAPRAAPEPATAEAHRGGGEAILIVEDDPDVRAFVAEQTRALGYQVLEAAEGTEAMAILESDARVDLLLTDVMLPGGRTGRALAQEARRLRPTLRTLFTSGYTWTTANESGRVDSDAPFLSKPYRRSELAARIREALGDGQ